VLHEEIVDHLLTMLESAAL